MSLSFIEKSNLNEILKRLGNSYTLHLQDKYKQDLHFTKYSEEKLKGSCVGEYRAEEPIKSFFSRAKEKVSDYFTPEVEGFRSTNVIVGAKSCDLESFKIQDFVFMESEPKEQAYVNKRENSIIISADCTAFKEVCYCLYLGIKPYPEKGFDLNLSPVKHGYVVETGSEKGQKLINVFGNLFREATAEEVQIRDKARAELCEKLNASISRMNLPPKDSLYSLVKKGLDNPTWKKWADKCVECGACTHSCPTCHCFLLYDAPQETKFIRGRVWDSCQYHGFAVVAGGASPRPRLAQRLRNRYVKKFEFFPDVSKTIACTGCGRCIEACIGKIDMREVFKDLAK